MSFTSTETLTDTSEKEYISQRPHLKPNMENEAF